MGRNQGIDNANNHIGKAELSSFLRGFIDQQPQPTQDSLKYVVREPLATEAMFGLTPADFRQSDPKCILQPDHAKWHCDFSFLSSGFHGIEMDLLLHDILTYNAVDLLFNSSAVSTCVTYIIHLARTLLATHFMKKNLSGTSLVDERFLLQ